MSSVLRFRPLHNVFQKLLIARAYTAASAYVPPAQLLDIRDAPPSRGGQHQLQKPESPSFYSTTPSYYDHIAQIEGAISASRRALNALQLLPLPEFARQAIPPSTTTWKDQDAMSEHFGIKLTTTRYRKITALLSELNLYHRISDAGECQQLSHAILLVSSPFIKSIVDLKQANKKKEKKEIFDEYGRTYTVGKRKTSSARVWIVPTKKERLVTPARKVPIPQQGAEKAQLEQDEAMEELFGKEATQEPAQAAPRYKINPTTVLVNNIPLAEYFPLPTDRERVIRPIKLAGVLGGYNVFSLVRGGGTSGQSGAIAHGIAKGIALHEPSMAPALKAAKLLKRDPRMVERKKTGLAKARKRYTWVKR